MGEIKHMNKTDYEEKEIKKEHILVCISSSPTNRNIVETAARMASAFGGDFTAIYVKTPESDKEDADDKNRLEENLRYAEKRGADIVTVYGEDIAYQIAEFARGSQITKVVIGRNNSRRRHFWSKPALTDKLTEYAPSLEIHIIPDYTGKPVYKMKAKSVLPNLIPYPKDILITLLILAVTSMLGVLFDGFGFTDANIITVYLLGVLLTSLFTRGYTCSILYSFLSVAMFNFIFTEPRLTFNASDPGYPITFVIMFAASIISGTLAVRLKDQAKLSAQAAFRTKVLLDTNQLLQNANDYNDIIYNTALQIMKLLNRNVAAYITQDEAVCEGYIFSPENNDAVTHMLSEKEKAAIEAAISKKKSAGVAETKNDTYYLYLPLNAGNTIYGVIGINIADSPPDSFENSIVQSILSECMLALESRRNLKEKEMAAVLVKNEQLRANLLRAISHDLRTPLTSISGNASTLISSCEQLSDEEKIHIFTDIYDDSQWLISLVENMLSITKIEEGKLNFNMSIQLIDDVIEEALRHISRKSSDHIIKMNASDEMLLAKMDAALIVQVIINLIDNAIKYTPNGSEIVIGTKSENGEIAVSIADNGGGITDEQKEKVFEMFYTGNNEIADSRRGLGLGLALCRSIINAHGGSITLTDNIPHGCIFTFTLPASEVKVNE